MGNHILISISQKVNVNQRKQLFLNVDSTVSLSQRNLWDILKENKGEQILGSELIKEHGAVQ